MTGKEMVVGVQPVARQRAQRYGQIISKHRQECTAWRFRQKQPTVPLVSQSRNVFRVRDCPEAHTFADARRQALGARRAISSADAAPSCPRRPSSSEHSAAAPERPRGRNCLAADLWDCASARRARARCRTRRSLGFRHQISSTRCKTAPTGRREHERHDPIGLFGRA